MNVKYCLYILVVANIGASHWYPNFIIYYFSVDHWSTVIIHHIIKNIPISFIGINLYEWKMYIECHFVWFRQEFVAQYTANLNMNHKMLCRTSLEEQSDFIKWTTNNTPKKHGRCELIEFPGWNKWPDSFFI